MKISELVKKSGVPKSAIHYYTRAGLLPGPKKTHSNTGEYDNTHLDRLKLILDLREQGQSIAPIKRILELVDEGVELGTAITLQEAVYSNPGTASPQTVEDILSRTKLQQEDLREAVSAGLFISVGIKDAGADEFDEQDLVLADALAAFLAVGIKIGDLRRISELAEEISAIEFSMGRALTEKLSPQERSETFVVLQEATRKFHSYLFSKYRQREIYRTYRYKERPDVDG